MTQLHSSAVKRVKLQAGQSMRRQNFNAVKVFQDEMEKGLGDDNVTLYIAGR
jgi:hypothetical protein